MRVIFIAFIYVLYVPLQHGATQEKLVQESSQQVTSIAFEREHFPYVYLSARGLLAGKFIERLQVIQSVAQKDIQLLGPRQSAELTQQHLGEIIRGSDKAQLAQAAKAAVQIAEVQDILIVGRGSNLIGVNEIRSQRIAVLENWAGSAYFQQRFPSAQIRTHKNIRGLVQDLVQAQCDAVLVNNEILPLMKEIHQQRGAFRVIGTTGFQWSYWLIGPEEQRENLELIQKYWDEEPRVEEEKGWFQKGEGGFEFAISDSDGHDSTNRSDFFADLMYFLVFAICVGGFVYMYYRARLQEERHLRRRDTAMIKKQYQESEYDLLQAQEELARTETELYRVQTEALAIKRNQTESAQQHSLGLQEATRQLRRPSQRLLAAGQMLALEDLTIQQNHLVDVILGASQDVIGLVHDLRELDLLERNKVHIERQAFSMNNCLRSVMMRYRAEARSRGVILEHFQRDNRVPSQLLGDPLRVRNVLQQVVAYLLNYDDCERISLGFELNYRREDEVSVTCAITGAGITADVPRLQEQMDQSRQRKTLTIYRERQGPQAGINLDLAMRLAEKLGGTLRLRRSAQDNQLDFICSLPFGLQDSDEALESYEDKGGSVLLPRLHLQVLLLEDDELLAGLIQVMLERINCEVTIVSDESSAWAEIEKRQYAVALIDSDIADFDALEWIDELQAQIVPNHRPACIVLSDDEERPSPDQCREKGLHGYLLKPFGNEQLVDQMTYAIDMNRATE